MFLSYHPLFLSFFLTFGSNHSFQLFTKCQEHLLLLVWAGFLLIINVIGPQSLVLVSVKMRALTYPPPNVACSVTHSRAVHIAKAQRYEEILGLAVNKVYLQGK